MLRWLILASLAVVCVSEPEVEAAPAASPIRVLGYEDEYRRLDRERDEDDLEEDRGRERDGHGRGPNVGPLVDPSKLLRSHGKGYNSRAEKIIKNVYSPDFYQPTWILDYRYLKTGGREYTRSDGGQVLILPKHVASDEHTEFKNYDQLLEFLRIKQLSEAKAHLLHPEENRRESHGYREERREVPQKWQGGWL